MGTGLSFVIFLIILGLLVAAMRRGSSAVKEKPNRLMSFATSMPLPDVIKAIIRHAQSNGYEISDISREDRLIIGEPPSLTTWGFFYPIYLSERPDASTSVEVGIKSKVLQVGPVIARSHENFVNGVKAAILADGGTVDEHDASEPPFDRERRESARNLLRRVEDLPIAVKVAGAVVVALLLLTILSPLGLLVALVLFVVSVAALILRVVQRRSVKGWGIVAVASLFLVLAFGSISYALYGSESGESTGVSGDAKDRGAKEKKDAAREEVQDRLVKATQEAPPPKQQVVPDPATKRYNEQVRDYNKRVQENNSQMRQEAEQRQRAAEQRRLEICAEPGPPYC